MRPVIDDDYTRLGRRKAVQEERGSEEGRETEYRKGSGRGVEERADVGYC